MPSGARDHTPQYASRTSEQAADASLASRQAFAHLLPLVSAGSSTGFAPPLSSPTVSLPIRRLSLDPPPPRSPSDRASAASQGLVIGASPRAPTLELPQDRSSPANSKDTLVASRGSSSPEPHIALNMRRRSSLAPPSAPAQTSQAPPHPDPARQGSSRMADNGQSGEQRGSSPAYTSLTLSQRRRSSMFVEPPLTIESTSRSLFSWLLPSHASPTRPLSNSMGGGDVAYSSAGSSATVARRPSTIKGQEESYPSAGGLHTLSESAGFQRKATNRGIRRFTLRVAVTLAFLFFVVRGWGYSRKSLSAFAGFGLEEVPEFDTVQPENQPKSSAFSRKKKFKGTEEPLVDEWSTFRQAQIWGAPEQALETLVVEPSGKHLETVIFIHGLAQHSWDSPLSSHLALRFPSIRWVMPQAPLKPILARANESTPAWFNMAAFPYDNGLDEDPVNLYGSAREINAVIRAERNRLVDGLRRRGGIAALPEDERTYDTSFAREDNLEEGEIGTWTEREWASARIVLSGFSQGGVMTLLTGLTTKYRLAGLIVLSGFLPLRSDILQLTADLDRESLPVFWGHGQADPYLLYEDALHSVELLQAMAPDAAHQGGLGLSGVEFHGYPGLEHSWFLPEVEQVGNWLDKVLPSRQAASSSRRLALGRDQYRP